MSKSVGIAQSDNKDNLTISLTISLNNSGEIVIEHDCDDYHAPYALIEIDKWQGVKTAIDGLIETSHENKD